MNILNVCNGVHQALHEVKLNYHLKFSWYGYFVKLSTVLVILLFFTEKYFNEKTLGKPWDVTEYRSSFKNSTKPPRSQSCEIFNIDYSCKQNPNKWSIENMGSLSATENCNFCHSSKETIFYFLLDWKYSKCVWKFVHNVSMAIAQNMPCEEMIGSNTESDIANMLHIIVKTIYFYRCRCQKKIPNIKDMQKEMAIYWWIEESIAKRTNKLTKFNKRCPKAKFLLPVWNCNECMNYETC